MVTSADHVDNLQHVFAGQLHRERHHPPLARRHNLLKVPLADPAITVPGVRQCKITCCVPARGPSETALGSSL